MRVIKKPPFISCQTELGQQIETHQSHSTWRSDTGKLSPSASLQRLCFRQVGPCMSEKTLCANVYILLDVFKCPAFNLINHKTATHLINMGKRLTTLININTMEIAPDSWPRLCPQYLPCRLHNMVSQVRCDINLFYPKFNFTFLDNNVSTKDDSCIKMIFK